MIKAIFNKRFLKYFLITLLAVQLVVALYVIFRYLDDFVYSRTTFTDICKLCFSVMASLLTESVCIAAAFASFFAFRHLPGMGTAAFLRTLAIGVACFIPLSIGIYMYDLHVQPRTKAQSTGILWKMKSGTEHSDGFLNSTPALSTAKTLSQTIASLEAQAESLRGPDDEYEYLDVAYELDRYRTERSLRRVMAITLLFCFLLFASVGYLSRNQTMKKILGVLAVIIVAVSLVMQVRGIVKQHMTGIEKEARMIKTTK